MGTIILPTTVQISIEVERLCILDENLTFCHEISDLTCSALKMPTVEDRLREQGLTLADVNGPIEPRRKSSRKRKRKQKHASQPRLNFAQVPSAPNPSLPLLSLSRPNVPRPNVNLVFAARYNTRYPTKCARCAVTAATTTTSVRRRTNAYSRASICLPLSQMPNCQHGSAHAPRRTSATPCPPALHHSWRKICSFRSSQMRSATPG